VNADGRQTEPTVALGQESKMIAEPVCGSEYLTQARLGHAEGIRFRAAIDSHGCRSYDFHREVVGFIAQRFTLLG
jgi:hypothetical protein